MTITRMWPDSSFAAKLVWCRTNWHGSVRRRQGGVDLTDLDMWALGVPYEQFARLRSDAPVAWSEEPDGGPGFWSVLCYVNGALIPVDGAATAVDIGTVPFDPRVTVRGNDEA
jgi:hypothetical protein